MTQARILMFRYRVFLLVLFAPLETQFPSPRPNMQLRKVLMQA